MTDPSALDPQQKLTLLRQRISELGSVVVCFSGGIDSAFLLKVATEELGAKAIGLTAVSPSLPYSERVSAEAFAKEIGATHRLVNSDELSRSGYQANGPDRCFHCKSELYTLATQKSAEWGFSHVANGTNTDDFGDYRPGLEAAKQHAVLAPLVEAHMNKADVRAAAKLLGMPLWDKPAAACLSSRIPYGTPVTRARLAQIEGLEAALRMLGFRQVRVRYHETIARIELPLDEMPRLLTDGIHTQVVESGKAHGFKFVTLDLEGYRTGSLNELLTGRSLRIVSESQ